MLGENTFMLIIHTRFKQQTFYYADKLCTVVVQHHSVLLTPHVQLAITSILLFDLCLHALCDTALRLHVASRIQGLHVRQQD